MEDDHRLDSHSAEIADFVSSINPSNRQCELRSPRLGLSWHGSQQGKICWPSLRGKPIALGGGVLLAASYEAKTFVPSVEGLMSASAENGAEYFAQLSVALFCA